MQAREVYFYPFFKLGTGWNWVVKATPASLHPGGCSPTRARNPDHPARSVSLFRGCHVIKEFRASGVFLLSAN